MWVRLPHHQAISLFDHPGADVGVHVQGCDDGYSPPRDLADPAQDLSVGVCLTVRYGSAVERERDRIPRPSFADQLDQLVDEGRECAFGDRTAGRGIGQDEGYGLDLLLSTGGEIPGRGRRRVGMLREDLLPAKDREGVEIGNDGRERR